MKILSLTSENVKRIQVVQITPAGNMVVIGGKNAQGKTSVLDSITMALAGGKSIPAEPIRKGQKTAEITLDLGELVVTRKFSETAGPSLVVKGADGVTLKSPQAILDKLTSRIAFDPLGFIRMEPAIQKDTLQKLVGLDFTAQDAERIKIYNNRTVKNREVERARFKVQSAAHFPNAPTKADSPTELLQEMQTANAHNSALRELQVSRDRAAENLEQLRRETDGYQKALNAAQRALDEAKQRESGAGLNLESLDRQLAEKQPIATAELEQKIATAEEVASQVRANAARAVEVATLRALEKEAEGMTTAIEAIDKGKADALAAAKFPVDGLGFDDAGVTFTGLPFSQASAAEQLRVSVAMGIAMNPKLKVLLIRDGSLLDEQNLGLVATMAQEHDAQVWIERVGEGKEVSVIIEDGRVKEKAAGADLTLEAGK